MDNIIVTPLGTVSPYTKGNMNCPGYLIEYHNKKILLDCGNGTTRLLTFPDVLNNLSVIITHYHKDHFGDIGALQYASRVYHKLGKLEDKIKIYLPKNDFEYSKASIISNNESHAEYIDVYDGYSFNIDDLNITFYNNGSHTIESFMVKLENENNKIVYTSDIGNTNLNGFIDFIKDADLLICESSFLVSHRAHSKTHLTAREASIIASEANVKKLVLTHFWPEEDKELYLREAKENFDNVSVAHEGEEIVIDSKTLVR